MLAFGGIGEKAIGLDRLGQGQVAGNRHPQVGRCDHMFRAEACRMPSIMLT